MDTFDIASEIEAINRTVGRRRIANGDGRSVVLRRSYDAAVEDVWDACSDPDRLKRWFGSVSGDLRLGGGSRSRAMPAARSSAASHRAWPSPGCTATTRPTRSSCG